MQLSRRLFLASMFSLPLVGRFAIAPAAFAIAPAAAAAVAAAAAQVLSSILEYAKRSGDLEKEFDALHAKLDVIIQNQIRLIGAISEAAADIATLLLAVSKLPHDTTVYGYYIDARSVTTTLADGFSHNDKNRVLETLTWGYTLATKVRGAAQDNKPNPNLALAARHLLVATQALASSKVMLAKHQTETLADTATHLRAALESLTAPTGIMASIPDQDAELARWIESVKAANLHLLPHDFSDPESVLSSGLNFCTLEGRCFSANDHMVCVRSPFSPPVFLKETKNFWTPRCPPGHGMDFCDTTPVETTPTKHWYRTRDLTRSWYRVTRTIAFGNLPCYEVELNKRLPPEVSKWKQYIWSSGDQRDYHEEGTDNPWEIDVCPELSLGENGSDWLDFQNRLVHYNGSVVLKSRTLAIQSQAEADLAVVKKVQDRVGND